MKSPNAAAPEITPLIPRHRNMPQTRSEVISPPTPSRIMCRRPCRSDRFAQYGAAITHSSADTEKAAATALSFTPSDRPSAGSTDCSAVFPAAIANGIIAGSFSMYVVYDTMHYALHHTKLPSYLREMKRYHIEHHYKNYDLGFGVTSKIWDYVFRTVLA